MPVKRKPTRKKSVLRPNSSRSLTELPTDLPMTSPSLPLETKSTLWTFRRLALGVLIIGLLFVLWTQKGRFVAAVVNGKPIWRSSVTQTLESRYGQQILESLVNEAIIEGAAKKVGVTVSKKDVDTKEAEFVKNLGEKVSLEEVLKFQGLTKVEFDKQVRLQLQVERILAKDLRITEDDINKFIASNRALLTATQPGELRQEARDALKNQKLGQKVQTWFAEVQKSAQVSRFVAW